MLYTIKMKQRDSSSRNSYLVLKPQTNLFIVPAFLVICLWLTDCTSISSKTSNITEPVKTEATKQTAIGAQNSKRPQKPDTGLTDPAFKKLKPEVLIYLEQLADAFSSNDKDYILAQAEPYYRQTYANLYETGEFLAMLYRIGVYSSESGYGEIKRPILNLSNILGITYTGWDELGPVIEVRGKILFKNGKFEPCRLILIWRAGDIKIKGFEP